MLAMEEGLPVIGLPAIRSASRLSIASRRSISF